MKLRVLGPLEAMLGTGELASGTPTVYRLLVTMVLHLGKPLTDAEICACVWGEVRPKGEVSRYVGILRTMVRQMDPEADLVRKDGLLTLHVPRPDEIDLHRFRGYLKLAEKTGEEPEAVLAALTSAIEEFRGEPWAGLTVSPKLASERNTLVEERKGACLRRIQVLVALGRDTEAVAAQDECARRWSDDERFWQRGAGRRESLPAGLVQELFEPDNVLGRDPLPSAMLQAEYRVVPFDEVDDQLVRLKAWLQDPGALDLRLLTGPGGRGKTRLAHELVRFARRGGWTAGVIRENAPDGSLDNVLAGQGPVLLVIDYAEGRTGEVTTAVRAALGRTAKVRVLLLARSAELLLGGVGRDKDARIAELLARMAVEQVRPLPAGEGDRRRWFDLAVRAFVARLPAIPAESVRPPVDLDDDRYDRMLDVHAVALAAVLDVVAAWDTPTEKDPLSRVLDHEERYWLASVDVHDLVGATLPRLRAVVAAATLFGADTLDGADQLMAGLRTFRDVASHVVDGYVAWLEALYPGSAVLNPLRPDRLGEDLAIRFLGTERGARAVLAGPLDDYQLIRALVVLARASARHDEVRRYLAELVEPEKENRLPVAIAVASQVESPQLVEVITELTADDPGLTESIVGQLPHSSLALSVFAAAQTRVLLRIELSRDPVDVEFVAEVWQNLALRLFDVGEFDDALAAAGMAVQGYRDFKTPTPDDRVGLAVALDTLATAYSKLGMYGDAIDVANEAVELFEDLLEAADPGHTDSEERLAQLRASSLITVGSLLDVNGAPESGLPHLIRAVDELRELARADHPDVQADYASGLQDLGNCWASLGDHDKRLDACAKAVDILRALDSMESDAYRTDLVNALSNIAAAYAELRRTDLGVELSEEAVQLARALVVRHGRTHDVLLATALTNAGSLLRQAERHEEALKHAVEAVAIFRGLATRQPGEHLAGLADALYNLGIDLLRNGQADEALDAYDESAGIYRKLAEPRPEEFEPELAAALVGKANALSDLDDDESALDLATEAVGMLRRAVRSESLELKEKLADALHTASGVAYCLGHFDRATKDGVEAVELYRSVIAEGRGDLDGVFTPILRNAVRSAVGDKQYDVALPLTKEVIGLLEDKVREGDVDVDELDDLAVDCFNAAAYAAHLGDFDEAAQLASKAVELRRTLLNTKFESVAELAEALTHHANIWSNAGHHSRAVAPAEEAVRLLAAFTDEERCPYLVSALVAQACATAVTDRVSAIGLLDEAMGVAGEDEALQEEVEEGRIEAGVVS